MGGVWGGTVRHLEEGEMNMTNWRLFVQFCKDMYMIFRRRKVIKQLKRDCGIH